MWDMLLNSKAGASAAAALFSDAPSNVLSGQGPFDARSFMDGSGWTVSTGSASATGARDARGPYGQAGVGGAGAETASAMQAGVSPLLMLALLGALAWRLVKG
jgi:hypothetical protein